MTPKIRAVFLPGKLCDQRLWQESMHELADLVEPIFVDLRFQQTLEDMVTEVYNACNGPFILIGFSMGGYIAQEFALQYPARILGLALIGVSADEYSNEEKSQQLRFIDNVKQFGFRGLSDIALSKFIHPLHYASKAELVKDMARESGAQAFINQHLATMNRRSRLTRLSKLNYRIIIIAGRDDQAVSLSSIKDMAAHIPKSELHIIDNCGHMIPLEQPEELNKVLKNWIESEISALQLQQL